MGQIKTITNLLIAVSRSMSWHFTTSAAMCTIAIIHRFLNRSLCYHHFRYRGCGPRLFLIDYTTPRVILPTDWSPSQSRNELPYYNNIISNQILWTHFYYFSLVISLNYFLFNEN